MKVVLFCGGLGMRLKEASESTPKPLVNIGYRPILWHVMKYYAHYGHRDFILCLGYKADAIKQYFLNYDECVTNNFVLMEGGRNLKLLNSDIQDWKITFVDTGTTSNIGQRLLAVREHLAGEESFLANYTDGLSDLPMDDYLQHFEASGSIGSFVCVKPTHTFHIVNMEGDLVSGIQHITEAGLWMNGGFFAFKQKIFDYINEGEELVLEPFNRLMSEKKLTAYKYDGFWACMDTFKEKQQLEDLYSTGHAPWEVWKDEFNKDKKKAISIHA